MLRMSRMHGLILLFILVLVLVLLLFFTHDVPFYELKKWNAKTLIITKFQVCMSVHFLK